MVEEKARKAAAGEAARKAGLPLGRILPGDCIAGAIALHESEATMADVILYAGCAPQRVHAGLRWLDLRDGSHARSASQNQRMLGGSVLTYLPRLGELIAAYAR